MLVSTLACKLPLTNHNMYSFFERCIILCYITVAGVAKLLAKPLRSELTMTWHRFTIP